MTHINELGGLQKFDEQGTAHVDIIPRGVEKLTFLNGVTTNQTSAIISVPRGRRTMQTVIIGTGAVAATLNWYGSNTANGSGVLLATHTLSGTTTDTAGSDISAEWPYVYCVLSGISGTGRTVTATVGV